MEWLINNWSLLVLIGAVGVYIYIRFKKWNGLPSEEQLKKIKAFLLATVIEAERQFKSSTGRLKLSWAYSQFIKAFPSLSSLISFEMFSALVDEVLVEMRNLLENNEQIRKYVEGE